MSQTTGIEWTDATWNPIRGCSRVSEGCRHCYAEGVAFRFSGPGQAYEGLVQLDSKGERKRQWNGEIKFVEKHLLDPLKWKEPRRIFVNSMSDLFHENVTDEMRDKIFAVMALCPQHTFQVLTKRPERMLAYLADKETRFRIDAIVADGWQKGLWLTRQIAYNVLNADAWPLPNVWLGVSDEGNQHQRIDVLRQVPAAVRFISAEPLIFSPDTVDLSGIDWVIVGGESGPGARPMHPDWARSLRDQCVAAGVPFFFKQWGEFGAGSFHASTGEAVFRHFESYNHWTCKGDTWVNGGLCLDADGKELRIGRDFMAARFPATVMHRVGKKAAGHLLDGKEWHQFPGATE